MRKIFLIMLVFTMAGCSSTKNLPVSPDNGYCPDGNCIIETPVTLRFKLPVTVETPIADPVSVEDHILCGLFLFEQGKYGEADEAFRAARHRIADPPGELYRSCLLSSAVCKLLANDRAGYVKDVQALKASYNQYQLIYIERNNPVMMAIFDLQNQFSQTDNY